jgi:DmsE family decaheme c-type cytochrome
MIGVVTSAVILFLFSFVSFSQDKAKGKKGGVVGSETCKDCHEDLYKGFMKDTPHWKSIADTKIPEEKKGCESCHGPGEKHAEAQGKGFIFSFKDKNAKVRSDACLNCHTKNKKFFQSDRGVHKLSAVGCNDCHQVHQVQANPKLLRSSEPDLCFSCHSDVKSQFYLPSSHKVIEGELKCTDCHTPHGTRTRASLRKWNKFSMNDDACFKCHPEKRGPWVFEHMPVKVEGCSSCHKSHGSANRFLLIRPDVRTLCFECHGQRHFAAISSCINCHTQIHGSNFSSRFFQ